jgi:hypothetical protein
VGVQQSRVQRPKRGKTGAIAIDSGWAEIWLAQRVVNAAKGLAIQCLKPLANPGFRIVSQTDGPAFTIGGKRPSACGGEALSGKAAFPGFHHFDRLFALPRPRDWASVARF